jgi:hypothetical protein
MKYLIILVLLIGCSEQTTTYNEDTEFELTIEDVIDEVAPELIYNCGFASDIYEARAILNETVFADCNGSNFNIVGGEACIRTMQSVGCETMLDIILEQSYYTECSGACGEVR